MSIATVSRVYNGARDVGAATAARVRAAGDELGYRPRSAARALPTGRARVFGAVFNDAHCEVRPDHPFFGSVLSSFSAAVAEAGYEVLLLPRLEGDSRYLARAREHALSGLIVFGGGHDAQVEPLVGEGIPVVGVDYAVGREGCDSVTSANAAGMRLVVEHLVELGPTAFGFIGGSPETTAAIERLGGFSAALLEHGLALRPEWLVTSDFTFAGGRAAARSLQGSHDRSRRLDHGFRRRRIRGARRSAADDCASRPCRARTSRGPGASGPRRTGRNARDACRAGRARRAWVDGARGPRRVSRLLLMPSAVIVVPMG